jgi:membrane-associated phospholipid phosphatase
MFLLQNNLLQKLEQWDQRLFMQINTDQSNVFFDGILPFIRNAYFWAPLYLFLLVFIPMNYKRGLWWCLIFLCTVSLCDMTSTNLFKEIFHRLRPCADPDFFQNVRLVVDRCGGNYSFTSNHAANHFGMATFIFVTLRPVFKKWVWFAFLWAALIGYAQIYVGVHYPFDIVGGAAVGFTFGSLLGNFFNKRFGFANFDE